MVGLKSAGVNASDVSSLTEMQWRVVCRQLELIPPEAWMEFSNCSAEVETLTKASSTHCYPDKDKDLPNLLCASLTAMVCSHFPVQLFEQNKTNYHLQYEVQNMSPSLVIMSSLALTGKEYWPVRRGRKQHVRAFYRRMG